VKGRLNALLFMTVLLPSVWAGVALRSSELVAIHPITVVNVLFFLNVCVVFWLVSLAQKSAWLIDAHWTTLPVLIGLFYASHPSAQGERTRSLLVLGLVGLWSARLTHSYFRREGWQFGAREDWRFAERRASPNFWWMSFFYAFVSQQVLLVGLTLPLWAIEQRATPFGWPDLAIAVLALGGIVIAYLADTELHRFVRDNQAREARGEPRVLVLETGLWRYARHPNYFGEQLFWWSLALYGARVGHAWVIVGPLLNSLLMYVSSRMVEARMLAASWRADAYREYASRTALWIPWPFGRL
jgi:steroid 5-alpha reductase family enzyme